MKKVVVLLAILVFSVMLIGCAQNDNPYANYNAQQGGAAPVVGGGCGVSQSADYANTPSVDSQAGF